jgi:hypothetical protein
MTHGMEAMARTIFIHALAEERCGELLECLFDGGSATVDAETDKLVMITAGQLAEMSQR